jgi:predicted DNA-binding mobile mystery protein A
MKQGPAGVARLRLKQLDSLLATFQQNSPQKVPAAGWLHEVRVAMGMPARWVANRMGITPSGVSHLERREATGSVTLEVLRKAADAMDCELVYAIVPRAGSVSKALEHRARAVATQTLSRVSHTMRLEDQATSSAEQEAEIDDLVHYLLARPQALWE